MHQGIFVQSLSLPPFVHDLFEHSMNLKLFLWCGLEGLFRSALWPYNILESLMKNLKISFA